MKWRCLSEPAFVIVEADDAYEAQLKSFALYVRDLSPSHISVDEVRADDPWAESSRDT